MRITEPKEPLLCPYCNQVHSEGQVLCYPSRRMFIIGGLVTTAAGLAPMPKYWQPYEVKCGFEECESGGTFTSFHKEVTEAERIDPKGARIVMEARRVGLLSDYSFITEQQLPHDLTQRHIKGTRNWLGPLSHAISQKA